jgi:ABC-type sulfate/molybdate transport systems ATPase subunit
VLTTHNMATGLRLGTRVAVLSRGRLVHMRSSAAVADGPALVDLLEQLAHT